MSDPIEMQTMGTSAKPAPPLPPRHSGAPAPGTLGQAYRVAEEKAKAMIHLQEGGMDATSVWGVVLSSWQVSLLTPIAKRTSDSGDRLSLLAIPLLLFPRILIFFAQTPPPTTPFSTDALSAAASAAAAREDHYDTLTPLEYTLCLSLAMGLIAMALVSLFILVPTYAPPAINPSRAPLLGILVGLTTIAGGVLWNAAGLGGLRVLVGGGNVLVAVWGWWVVVFGDGRGQMTKTERHKHKTPERFKKL